MSSMIRGIIVVFLIGTLLGAGTVFAESPLISVTDVIDPTLKYQSIENGTVIEGRLIGPGLPPPGWIKDSNLAEESVVSANAVNSTDVPAMSWSYGCSATSATMMFGYFDRNGYPNMYVGPTNGGVFPLNNAAWGPSFEGNGQCPLTASQNGLDGRKTKGHKDDYYHQYDSSVDPYYGSWTEHSPQDSIGDFMGTSMYQKYGSTDGGTWFWTSSDGSPLYDYTVHDSTQRDGMHGMKLFVESRGYSVSTNYNQLIYGYNGNTKGFTYNQYKAEIDAGNPVLIQVQGHTMLGVGYSGSNTVILHDTWDYSKHTMTWGGSYSGMQHYAVGVIHLNSVPTITALNPGSVVQDSQANPFQVIITGTGFNTVSASGGVKVDGSTVTYTKDSSTQITATFPATVDNTVGNHPVIVTGSGGSSNSYNFVVTAPLPAPAITNLNPGSVILNSQSTPFPVIITGTGFDTVASSNNVTVNGTVVPYTTDSSTQINATFPATIDDTIGNYPVIVTGSSGASNPYSFQVTASGVIPTITTLNPGSVVQNSQTTPFPVIISGTGFDSVAATNNVTVNGTVIPYTKDSSTQINATFPATIDNLLGSYPVIVTGSGGPSSPFNFNVTPPVVVPTITNLNPGSVVQNSQFNPFPVIITGTGFNTVAASNNVTVDGSTVGYTVDSPTQITALFPTTIDNTIGNHPVIVTGSGGPSNVHNFVVTVPVVIPTITSLNPAFVLQNSKTDPFTVIITGTGFNTVAPSGGVTVDSSTIPYTVDSSSQISATFPASIDNTVGNHPVIVTGSGGSSGIYNFVVGEGFLIIATSDRIGWIHPFGKFSVANGSSVTFTFKPAAGAVIKNLTVNGIPVAYDTSNLTYTIPNVQSTYNVRLNNEALPGVVIAGFNAASTGGNSYRFEDASWGNPAPNAWKWDFGDGKSAFVNPVEHTYNDPGVYTVSLWARNNLSQSQEIRGEITVPLPSGSSDSLYFGPY